MAGKKSQKRTRNAKFKHQSKDKFWTNGFKTILGEQWIHPNSHKESHPGYGKIVATNDTRYDNDVHGRNVM